MPIKIGYDGPNKCPICDEPMLSWFHLETHEYELKQRAKNPTDRVILELKNYGCVVRSEP
jgi:hypothetical protein